MHLISVQNAFKQFGWYEDSNFAVFYGGDSQDILGNFWPLPSYYMCYEGINADNVECLYQSYKFKNIELRQQFNLLSAKKALRLAQSLSKFVREDWFQVNRKIMKILLKIKFSNGYLKKMLLDTGDKYLVKHSICKGDGFWSDDSDGYGQNVLGHMLMQIRGDLGGVGVVVQPVEYCMWIAMMVSKTLLESKYNSQNQWCNWCGCFPKQYGYDFCKRKCGIASYKNQNATIIRQ